MNQSEIIKLGKAIIPILEFHYRLNDMINEDVENQLANKFIEMVDELDFKKICQGLKDFGTKKAIKLSNNLAEDLVYFELSKESFLNKEKDNPQLDTSFLSAFLFICFGKLLSTILEFIAFGRTAAVLAVISEIKIRKTIFELYELDLQLNEFVEHNHLHSIDEADVFPINLIQQARGYLDRISLNYGKGTLHEGREVRVIESEEPIDFPVDIFLTLYNYQLFIHLVENYAKQKRPVDLSHIFRWMEEEQLIAKRSGKKYMKFTVSKNLVLGKFTRIADPDSKTRTPLNELRKAFEKSRVKTSK